MSGGRERQCLFLSICPSFPLSLWHPMATMTEEKKEDVDGCAEGMVNRGDGERDGERDCE